MKDDPVGLARGAVELRPYDPEWPQWFEHERAELLAAIPELLEVEHIGSTAVLGLEAKPIIDLQASLPSLSDWPQVVPRLVEHGYSFMADRVFETRVFLPKGPEERRTRYLSLIEADSAEWWLRLRFRDALRADRKFRQEYRNLKRRLLREHAFDRPAYTDAKSAFVAGACKAPVAPTRRARTCRDPLGGADGRSPLSPGTRVGDRPSNHCEDRESHNRGLGARAGSGCLWLGDRQ